MKRQDGQYFTRTNPFGHKIFFDWLKKIPKEYLEGVWCEPYAGSNNIVEMLNEVGIKKSESSNWECYDISPQNDEDINTSGVSIKGRDMINNYPESVPAVVVTNPPYLAKNSATRRGLAYPNTEYDDVYKLCLGIMLKKHKYVAAIIPESFIRTNLFSERLFAIISLNCEMFEDTDCPVCLALWVEKPTKDYKIYFSNGFCAGGMSELRKFEPHYSGEYSFNNPEGTLGLYGCDSVNTASIKFIDGTKIDPTKVKSTSRCITRIGDIPADIKLTDLITTCNCILTEWRKNTSDVFMTSFKGLRADGYYRRRLDWVGAGFIVDIAIAKIRG